MKQFPIGSLIELTDAGEKSFPHLRGLRATVVSVSKVSPNYIRVRFAGKKRSSLWHSSLFRAVDAPVASA